MHELHSILEKALYKAGASLIGFADIRNLPTLNHHSLPYAISIVVALDPRIVAHIADGPTDDYYNEYKRVNGMLSSLASYTADMLKEHGFRAKTFEPTIERFDYALKRTLRTSLQHKTVATRAGLGWIGKNALLITKKFGSAVRLASVLTDSDFKTGNPVNESLCGECTKCMDICPSHAPSGINWNVTMDRDAFFNAHACYRTAKKFNFEKGFGAIICGMCITVCPWTQYYIRPCR